MRYRTRIVEVDAIPFDGTVESARSVIDWTRGSETPARMGDMEGDHGTLYISTLEGEHKATAGDFIIRGLRGEHYPCKHDVFEKKYEAI